MCITRFSWLVFLVAITCNPYLFAQPSLVTDTEERALEARLQIKSGRVRMRLHEQIPPQKTELWHEFNIVFRDGHVRFEQQTSNSADISSDQDRREIKIILTPNEYFSFIPQGEHRQSTSAIQHGPASLAGPYEHLVFDLRTIGIVPQPWDLLCRSQMINFLCREDRLESSESEHEIDGLPAKAIKYTRSDRQTVTYVVMPSKAHSIVRVEFFGMLKDGSSMKQVIESRVREWGEQRIWFPETVQFYRFRDDDVRIREDWDVIDAEFNIDIHDSEFSLEALKPKVGQPVIGRATKDPVPQAIPQAVWDGDKLTPPETKSAPNDDLRKVDHGTPRFVVIANLVVLVIGVCVFAYLRKK